MFKYAICNEMFSAQPLAHTLDAVARMGYTGIELAPFTLVPSSSRVDVRFVEASARSQLRRRARDAGLEIVGLHWLFARTEGFHVTSPEPECRRRTAEYLVALAELIDELGGRVLVLGSPEQRNLAANVEPAEGLRYAAELLGRVMPRFEGLGVVLALEPLGPSETNFLNTAADAVLLVHQVNSSSCRLALDVKAMTTESKSIEEIIHANREWTVHFHANDPNLLGPGMGSVDFVPILAALSQSDYDGWISVEVFRYEPTPEFIARGSIDYLKKCDLGPVC